MDAHDIVASESVASVPGDQLPQTQIEPAVPSESELTASNGVATNGITFNGAPSSTIPDQTSADVSAFPLLPIHSSHFMPQMQNNAFSATEHVADGNGAVPLGLVMPVNPQLPPQAMSADEIALYDRQIRLWGMQAQQKIQAANILLISMRGLANEIAKNLVLAGIGALTIIDDQTVTEADLGAQFFLTQENVGQNRAEAASIEAQKLNPRVKVFADSSSIMTKPAQYFAAFDIVIATDLDPTLLAFINTATRLHNRQFYAAGVHGFYGYIFCDLIEHDYVLEREKSNVATKLGPESRFRSVIDIKQQKEGEKRTEFVTKRDYYSTWDLVSETGLLPQEYTKSKRRLKSVSPALSCLRALWRFQTHHSREPGHNKQDLEWFTRSATHNHNLLSLPSETLRSDFLRSFMQNVNSEIAPVTAILGGQLAQDVINVLGQKQQPIQNMVIFDGNKLEANVYPLHPEGKLGRSQLDPSATLPMAHLHMDLAQQHSADMSQVLPMGQSGW